APDRHVPLDVPAKSPGADELGGQRAPEREPTVGHGRAVAHDCTTVTIRPIEARTLPTRTHSTSAPTLTTALPVLCTCQASSQPLASLQPIAFWSCFTTCSKVWQSQLWRMVIHGGATAVCSSVTSWGRTSGCVVVASGTAIGACSSRARAPGVLASPRLERQPSTRHQPAPEPGSRRGLPF